MIVERTIVEIICDYCGGHIDRRAFDPTSSSPHWPTWRDAHTAALAAEWTTATGPIRCPECRTQLAQLVTRTDAAGMPAAPPTPGANLSGVGEQPGAVRYVSGH